MANTEPHVDSAGGSGEVMDRWKTDNCESGGDRLSSRSTSLSRRLIGLAGVAALTVGGAGAVLLGGGVAFATISPNSPAVVTNSFALGSGQASGLSVAPSVTVGNTASNYAVSFTASNAIAASGTITISIPDQGAYALPTGVSSIPVNVGGTVGSYGVALGSGNTTGTAQLTITNGSTAIAAGTVVSFTVPAVTNPSVAVSTTETASLTTSADLLTANSSYTILADATVVSPTFSSTSSIDGAVTSYKYASFQLAGTASDTVTTLSAAFFSATTPTPADVTLTTNPANYVLTDTKTGTSYSPSSVALYTLATGDVASPVSVNAASANAVQLTFNSGSGIALTGGDPLTLSMNNVKNPATGTSLYTDLGDLVTSGSTSTFTVADVNGGSTLALDNSSGATLTEAASTSATAASSFNSVALSASALTSVTSVSVVPNNATVSATSAYAISFKATTSATANPALTVTFPTAETFSTVPTAYVVDGTSVKQDPNTGTGAVTVSSNVVTVPLMSYAAGDIVSVTLFGVPNLSSVGSYSGTVNTDADANPVGFSYSLVAATTASQTPTVSVSSSTVGDLANYTISNIEANSTSIAGSSTNTAPVFDVSIAATATGGTSGSPQSAVGNLPTLASDYQIVDLTNSAGTGPAYSVSVPSSATVMTAGSPTAGYVDAAMQIVPSKPITAGDRLQIVITDVTNPIVVSSNYAVFVGDVTATSVAVGVPAATTTYPNGAFVQSGGQIDVIAGGVGFGIPTFNDYQQIATSDSSAVVSGSFPAGTAVRTGTLLKVLGSPAIYVVGTNGDAYAFSTPTEFTSDGYSAMSVVNVPNLGSLTTGSGAAPTAAVTMPDGALVQSGSTIYVYAGGKAFGIPTFADYQTIAAATGTQVVMGTVSNMAATSLTAGTLIQPIGSAGIWVSDGTSIYQFSTASQFASDGYNGANVVPVPNATGLTQA